MATDLEKENAVLWRDINKKREMIRRLEFIEVNGVLRCPVCKRTKVDNHIRDCELLDTLIGEAIDEQD